MNLYYQIVYVKIFNSIYKIKLYHNYFNPLQIVYNRLTSNNKILPTKWLTRAHDDGSFMAKTRVNMFSADPRSLANTVDNYIGLSNDLKYEWKKEAVQIAQQNFSIETLKPQYLNLIDGLRSKPII
jgi:hypothetical protein